MPEVKSADEATTIAVEFARRYKLVATPLSARKENGTWVVELDIGVFQVVKGQVRIEASTGMILDYQFPR